jgi:Vault protein inter-alpha-trypsin domain
MPDSPVPNPPGIAWLLPGVVLPFVTLGIELATGMNSAVFFDPLPSAFHVLLVALVPFANLAVWVAARRSRPSQLGRLALASGCAIGVALFYTVMFLPLSPIGVIAIVYFGVGLLPLTPLIALIASIRLRMHLSRLARGSQTPVRLWPGLVIGVGALIVLDLPATITRVGMQMATSEAPQTRARGIGWLRVAGSRDLLLRLCYVRSGVATDMMGFAFSLAHPVAAEDARKIYYRVTGTPFNAVPAPVALRPSRGSFLRGDLRDFDQGGDGVGGKQRGLSLSASRMDGSLDANAATAYVEWTLVFSNDAAIDREARAQIALPPGAVVSRLTLWIQGEEREAAFAGRAKARQAYEKIVRRSRDPVLVTSAGTDRAQMQLFPVPPHGEMKVRIGITVPLALNDRSDATLRLPYFHERNFDIAPQVRHAVWVESKTSLRSESGSASRVGSAFAVRLALDDSRLELPASSIVAARGEGNRAWSPDGKPGGYFVHQVVIEQAAAAPARLVVVVDGSVAMREAAPRIANALAKVPADMELALVVAGDSVIEYPAAGARLTPPAMAQRLENFSYAGGHDNVAALARGLDLTLAANDSALLWVHGPQPVLLATMEALMQRLERPALRPVWYDLQVQPGANLIGEKLDGVVTTVPVHREDLEALVSSWQPGARRLVAQRERLGPERLASLRVAELTSDHLVRLWANDEVARLLLSRGARHRENAVELAQQYQLVTPVSGAVVLETRQQYDEAGLEPVASGSVPSIPEPETWALLAVVALILAYSYGRRRRESHAGVAF